MQEFYVFAFVFAILALSGGFGAIPDTPESAEPERIVTNVVKF